MTPNEARDAMFSVLLSVWDPSYPIVWGDVPASINKAKTPWARPVIRHLHGDASTLGDINGIIMYEREGLLTVELYTPIADGYNKLYDLAQDIMVAYQKARLDVWFRKVTLSEIPTTKLGFNQINIMSDFTYKDSR